MNDPDFLDQIYAGAGRRREKYSTTLDINQVTGSIITTKDHNLHRRRRAALNPFFSKQNVRRLEPIIQRAVVGLLGRMEGWAKTSVPAPMNTAYQATTKDIIHEYVFGKTSRPNFIEVEDMNKDFFTILKPRASMHMGAYFPWMNTLMMSIPQSVVIWLDPNVAKILNYIEVGSILDVALVMTDSLIQELETQIQAIQSGVSKGDQEATIFHGILDSNMPDNEKSTKRLKEEAFVLVGAGTDTTASTLGALTYELLTNPRILSKLKAELKEAIPDPSELASIARLEGLPYLVSYASLAD